MAIKPVLLTGDRPYQYVSHSKGVIPVSGAEDSLPSMREVDGPQQPLCNSRQDPGAEATNSVVDIARILRLERYQKRRAYDLQARLHQEQLIAARSCRLLSIARSAQQTLTECIRCEDKQGFISLCSSFHDVITDSTNPSSNAHPQHWREDANRPGIVENFVDSFPLAQRSGLFDLLSSIRGDPTYVANRLSSLTQKELLAVLPQRLGSRSNDSVFGNSLRSDSRMSRSLGYVVDAQIEQIASLEAASPLEALVWSTRDLHKGLSHDIRAREIWARTCGKLVSDQKRGMERVVPAIIDVWASSSPWHGTDRVETWIGRTLQEGAFILDQPSRQSFRLRIQGRPDLNSEDEGKAEEFFRRTVQSLLELLADANGASAIPDMALILCRHICAHIPSEAQQHSFCSFVLTRWLFNSFVAEAITLPETYGMATGRYISDTARQRILREVVVRSQKAVYHAVHPWKHNLPVSKPIADAVGAIAGRFQGPIGLGSPPALLEPEAQVSSSDPEPSMLALSPNDVIMLIDTLHPEHRPASSSLDFDSTALHSSSSSVSGFSLFSSPSSSSTTLTYPSWSNHEEVKLSSMQFSENTDPENLMQTGAEGACPVSKETLRDIRASAEELLVADRYSTVQQLAIIYQDSCSWNLSTLSMDFARMERSTRATEEDPATRPSSGRTDRDFLKDSVKYALLDTQPVEAESAAQSSSRDGAITWLLQSLQRDTNAALDQGQYVFAHARSATLSRCKRILLESSGECVLRDVMIELEQETESSLQCTLSTISMCEERVHSLQSPLILQRDAVQAQALQCDMLRRKMLYTADVRTSAAYDGVRSIASALKVMGKPKKPLKTRMAPPLRHWSGSKVSSTNLHLKTEAQILEILSASANHGGPNKLSDDQSKGLAAWLMSNNVENLCAGEERLQKLCMEIRKAVDQLTADTSTLWTSPLAAPDSRTTMTGSSEPALSPLVSAPISSRFDALRLHTHMPLNRDSISNSSLSHPLSARSSRDFVETRSPTLTSRSSGPFWSPSASDVMSPASVTSMDSTQTCDTHTKQPWGSVAASRNSDQCRATIRKLLTSLLLSEVTASMFAEGSETDQAIWAGLCGDIATEHFRALNDFSRNAESTASKPRGHFDFAGALNSLTRRLETSCDPAAKLNCLVEIDTLIGLRESFVPRASPAGTRTSHQQEGSPSEGSFTNRTTWDAKIEGFRMLFCDPSTRPAAVFRDLQYIAALVPSIATEKSARGDAFWHASLAITGLKKEICVLMVETADSIIAYHSNNRGHGRTASSAQQQRDSATFSSSSRTPPPEDVAKYSMADAAHLLQITAKEGNAVAQRELATLYLTNPELMDHIIAPLARPKEVFKEELESKWRKNQDPTRCDPATMCVAHHWMNLSAKGGDALAKEYLKQREEMERLP